MGMEHSLVLSSLTGSAVGRMEDTNDQVSGACFVLL